MTNEMKFGQEDELRELLYLFKASVLVSSSRTSADFGVAIKIINYPDDPLVPGRGVWHMTSDGKLTY